MDVRGLRVWQAYTSCVWDSARAECALADWVAAPAQRLQHNKLNGIG